MKQPQNVIGWSVTVALAGFLFGFDTVVISGANQPIKALWNTSPWFHGTFIMSMALWGTVIGALLGGIPCEVCGRKKTLFWIGVLYFVSAIGSALAPDPYTFSFFRFIGGGRRWGFFSRLSNVYFRNCKCQKSGKTRCPLSV